MIEAIAGVNRVVQAMHVNIAHLPGVPRPAPPRPARGVTGLVDRSVRLIAGGVGQVLDASLARIVPALVTVHGLCMNEQQWRRRGQAPRRDAGAQAGADGAPSALQQRPACFRQLVFIATPRHGAPLERVGNWIDLILGVSPDTAPLTRLGQIRSAGITDLRYGNLVDADWEGRDRFAVGGDRRGVVPLPAGTACFAIAGSSGGEAGNGARRLLGHGFVPLDSVLGRHAEPGRRLGFDESRQWVGMGMGHL